MRISRVTRIPPFVTYVVGFMGPSWPGAWEIREVVRRNCEGRPVLPRRPRSNKEGWPPLLDGPPPDRRFREPHHMLTIPASGFECNHQVSSGMAQRARGRCLHPRMTTRLLLR